MADKKIPLKELRTATKDLNVVLKEQKQDTIKIVGAKTAAIFAAFLGNVTNFLDDKKEGLLPDSVIDFYNKYAADEEDTEIPSTDKPADKPAEKKTRGRKTADKKPTDKKPAGKSAETKTRSRSGKGRSMSKGADATKDTKTDTAKKSGAGVVELAVRAYQTEGIKTTKEICVHLEKSFPGRNISSTVSNVVCVLGHAKLAE